MSLQEVQSTATLLPLEFTPLLKRARWGGERLGTILQKPIGLEGDFGESWELSDHPEAPTLIASGEYAGSTLSEVIGQNPQAMYGAGTCYSTFPLLIKFIDATDRLSLQVHPDDSHLPDFDARKAGKSEAWVILDAARAAIETMSPVIVLSDAYLANAASDWDIPDIDAIPDLDWPQYEADGTGFEPFRRDGKTLARPWVAPGTPGLAHRIGGLEKSDGAGHISYDPANHGEMTRLRAEKIARLAERRPGVQLEDGPEDADLLVVGWGSTYGAIAQAVKDMNAEGARIAHVHLRQLNPLPRVLGDLLDRFPQIVTAEMNTGQLSTILRSEFLKDIACISNVSGQPFHVSRLREEFKARLEAKAK